MKKLVIFDFDNVIFRGQSQQYLVSYLIRHGKISFWVALQIYFWFFLRRIGFRVPPDNIRKIAYNVFNDWSIEFFNDFFRRFHADIVQHRYVLKACQLMKDHLSSGDDIVLVSASLKKIIENCFPFLGEVDCIATELETINNKYTGCIKGVVPYGDVKFSMIKEYVESKQYDWNLCIAYTDDFSDLQLLCSVGFPYAVNPDSRLRAIALDKGWEIYDF